MCLLQNILRRGWDESRLFEFFFYPTLCSNCAFEQSFIFAKQMFRIELILLIVVHHINKIIGLLDLVRFFKSINDAQ